MWVCPQDLHMPSVCGETDPLRRVTVWNSTAPEIKSLCTFLARERLVKGMEIWTTSASSTAILAKNVFRHERSERFIHFFRTLPENALHQSMAISPEGRTWHTRHQGHSTQRWVPAERGGDTCSSRESQEEPAQSKARGRGLWTGCDKEAMCQTHVTTLRTVQIKPEI